MKLLIITQKVDINDDVLGFMHGWIAEFAKHCDKLTVVCLQKGEYDLPDNVKVLSLGKENQLPITNYQLRIINKINYSIKFYRYIWKYRKDYDSVFVHMNPEYVVLGGLFWRSSRKKIGLWYTHKAVNIKLRIAEKIANVIFTASKESFRLKSKKLKIMGHGIDIIKFKNNINKNNKIFKIITVGRISPIKDYETLINAIEILSNRRNRALPCSNLQIDIIGAPITQEDEKYLEKLKNIIKEKKLDNIVNFVGSVPNKNIVQYYNNADLFVNMSMTGSLDKVILEAMASRTITLSCNDASRDLLEKYNLFFEKGDFKELAEKINKIINLQKEKQDSIQQELRDIVVKNHSLESLIKNIVKAY